MTSVSITRKHLIPFTEKFKSGKLFNRKAEWTAIKRFSVLCSKILLAVVYMIIYSVILLAGLFITRRQHGQ
jgi:hypothetical protein